ncbi:MAG: metallophosphatase [Proteobacteria bacterium]|jgi:hypothetical protein|nr:metallophosphatase [Pseudomonadota bacterium]
MNNLWASFLVVAIGSGCARAEEPTAAPATKIVALGDLHGDFTNALAVLELAGIVDEKGHWNATNTTLVQTGDTTDRGPQSKEVMDLIRRLQKEAAKAGGRVVPLLGNHEMMNLHGDWRYVSPEDVEGFGGTEERKRAFSQEGEYGQWLFSLDIAAKVEDSVFVHGGIHPDFAKGGVEELNKHFHGVHTAKDDPIFGSQGPLWYRGYAQEPEESACPRLTMALEDLGVKRMVVGHTTQRTGKIEVRCQGRLHMIDVGIAKHYGSNLAAWEWVDGDARALYQSGAIDLEDPS